MTENNDELLKTLLGKHKKERKKEEKLMSLVVCSSLEPKLVSAFLFMFFAISK
jgi:hypothetical protein